MGLKSTRVQKECNPVIFYFSFPEDDIKKYRLWNLWNENKQELKSDGFFINKEEGKWIIEFKSPNDKEEKKTLGDKTMGFVEIDFMVKCGKWEAFLNS